MKKIFLIKITLVSILLFFGFTSCNYDPFVPVGANDGALPENVRVYHLNPRTGAEYTDDELADLGYDPSEKEVYLIDQPVEIIVRGSSQPDRVEVISGGVILETITEFTPITTEFGEEFESAKFSTTVIDLGIEEGRTKVLEVNSMYDVGGGNAVSSHPYTVKYQGDISKINSGFQLVGKDVANTRFLGLDPNEARDLQSFESNRQGYTYDGAGQYATVSDDEGFLDFRHENDFSIGFWVRTTSDESDPEMIADQDWGSSWNKGFTIAFRGDNWRAVVSNDDEKADLSTDGIPFNDGQWHYLAVTFDRDGDMTMYQDGIAVENEDMSLVGSIANGNPIRIAQDGTGDYGQFFDGDIADAKVYDYVLSAQEVKDLAEEPTFPLLVSDASGASKTLNVALEGTTVTTFPNGMKGYEFDGVSQYGTIEDEGQLDFRYNSNFSISFWVNTTSDESDPEMIADQDWGSSGNKGITIAFRGDNWRAVASDGTEKADIDTDGIPFNDGQWHLLAITYDRGGDMIMYQDGLPVASESMAAITGSIESGNPLRFAQDGTANYGQFFQGKIAGTIIHNYALSADEISDLYKK